MSYLVLYLPITLIVLAVLEACKQDDPKKVLKGTLRNFSLLTAILVVGSIAVFFVNRYA